MPRFLTSIVLVLAALAASCSAAGGLVDGRLAPRPWTPNAATTDAEGSPFEPLAFDGDPARAFGDLIDFLIREDGAKVASLEDTYAHLVYRTRFFRFIDDVELRLDPRQGLVHVRSASRLGLWDLGVNGRRIESIRRRWRYPRPPETAPE